MGRGPPGKPGGPAVGCRGEGACGAGPTADAPVATGGGGPAGRWGTSGGGTGGAGAAALGACAAASMATAGRGAAAVAAVENEPLRAGGRLALPLRCISSCSLACACFRFLSSNHASTCPTSGFTAASSHTWLLYAQSSVASCTRQAFSDVKYVSGASRTASCDPLLPSAAPASLAQPLNATDSAILPS